MKRVELMLKACATLLTISVMFSACGGGSKQSSSQEQTAGTSAAQSSVSKVESTVAESKKETEESAPQKESTPEEGSSEIVEKPAKTYKYDELQTLFLNIDNTVTKEALVSMIQENGLEYTEVEYNEFYSFKVAMTHEIALQSRGEVGDHVSINFDKDTGAITDASYFNYNAWNKCYSYGNRESIFEGTNTMEPTQWEGSDDLVQFIGEKDAPIEHGVAQTNKKWVFFDSLESMLHSIMDCA